jgi:BirA family biotin operon repressor/biotin-[acetyl-CoA-carboxylase] ligase
MELRNFDLIDSTNLEARRIINDQENSCKIQTPLAIIAEKQLQGKGRLNRNWESEEGNIFLSIIIKNPAELKKNALSFIPIYTAKFLHKFIISECDFHTEIKEDNLKIKWPNDLLYEDNKLSGILVELVEDFVIIGIGINYNSSPSLVEKKTICLKGIANLDHNDKNDFINKLLKNFLEDFDGFIKNGDRRQAIISEYINSFLYKKSQLVSIKNTKNDEIKGLIKSVDIDGNLIIEQNQQIVKISTGEVE